MHQERMIPAFDFQNAVFTYAISSRPVVDYSKQHVLAGGELILSYTDKTDVYTYTSADCEVAVIGFCADALGEWKQSEIPQRMAEQEQKDIESIYRLARRFAGRYVIYYRNETDAYLIPDAYGLLEANYGRKGKDLCIASVDKTVGDYFDWPVFSTAVGIKKCGDYSKALPYQITMYEDVKILIPNHYLTLSNLQMTRVPLDVRPIRTTQEIQECVDRTITLVLQILKAYRERYDIVCPLTAGRDSRVVLSFLKRDDADLTCYTFRHAGFTDKTPDIAIPREICRDLGLKYEVLDDIIPDQAYLSAAKSHLGAYCSDATLSRALTFSARFPNKIMIHSDILDQIGKSSLSNNIPSFLGVPSFFVCKLHNFSGHTKGEMKKMLDDMGEEKSRLNPYDLYCIEQEGVRWVAQGLTAYSVCGVTALNLFNCGLILDLWLGLERKMRMKHVLHKKILEQLEPQLLQYPVNPGAKYGRIKKSSFLVWLGSYVQYWMHCLKRRSTR